MVYSTRRFVVCLSVCHFVLVFFSPFSIAITSLGEERANLSAFRTFVRFVPVWICRFPLSLGVWEGLRFVIVALPGLFSYLFFWSLYANRFFLCISALGVASGTRVKLASCKSASNPPVVYSTDSSKAVVPVLVLLFVALWFILRGDLFYVLPCVILFLCFSVLLALRLPHLWKRKLIFVLFVRLFDLCLFKFVGFLFLLVSGKDCGL